MTKPRKPEALEKWIDIFERSVKGRTGQKEFAGLVAVLRAAKKDRERLDWLDGSRKFVLASHEAIVVYSDREIPYEMKLTKVRPVIDAAMKAGRGK